MKKIVIILLALFLVSCSNDNNATEQTEDTSKIFTEESLKEFNGKDGSDAYIAIDGIVYDVSDEVMWMEGIHQGRFRAGMDLTEDMKKAPHGLSKLKNLKEVGKYEE